MGNIIPDLNFVSDGTLLDYVPLRIHQRGRRVDGRWEFVDELIVMMMSDIIEHPIFEKGVNTGKVRKHFVRPTVYVPNAWAPDAPVANPWNRAISGTFENVLADGEETLVLLKRDKGDTSSVVHLLVREGWKPSHKTGRYIDSYVEDLKKRISRGMPGSFLLGNKAALVSASSEAQDEDGGNVTGRTWGDTDVGDRALCHWGLHRLAPKDSVIGQRKNGDMWQVTNVGGILQRRNAEDMRPLFDRKEKERVEKAKDERVARLRKEKEGAKAARLRKQEELVVQQAAPAPLEILDDQVGAPSEEATA